MTTQGRSRDCTIPLWLAGLATLALAGLAYLLVADGLRAGAERQANAALQAAGLDWAQFRVADRLGVIDGAPPSAQSAAAANAAVNQALAGQIGFPGVIAAVTVAAGAAQLELRGVPREPETPTAPPVDLTPPAPPPVAASKPSPPPPAPAPELIAPAPVRGGAPIVGAKLCEAAIQDARAKRAISFATGSAVLGPNARAVVAEIAAAAARCQNIRIEIAGHTDTRGAAFANQTLSEARADAVREALIVQKVRAEVLVARGYGETRPLTQGARMRDHARNRRITFTVVDAP